jgi:hypothetical protein
MTAEYPGATWHLSPNFTPGNQGRLAVVVHIAEGGYPGTLSHLTNPASGVSSHFLIGEDGVTAQLVKLGNSAWTNGLSWRAGAWRNPRGKIVTPTWRRLTAPINPNLQTITIELAGWHNRPRPAAQRTALVGLLAWLARRFGWLPYEVGEALIGHYHLDPADRAFCPGPHVDLNSLAAAVNATTGPAPLRVIGVRPSVPLARFLDILRRRRAPFGEHLDTIGTRIYTLCDWLDIDPAFWLALWMHEQGADSLGGSEVGQATRNPLNLKAYGRWPAANLKGSRWNTYESWQLGAMHSVMHLKELYGGRGLLDVETIIPVFAPEGDGNNPLAYIAAVRRDMAAMRESL